MLALQLPIAEWAAEEGIDESHLRERIITAAETASAEKAQRFRPGFDELHRKIRAAAQRLTMFGKEHLSGAGIICAQGIHLRAVGQRTPDQRYISAEAFLLFNTMLDELIGARHKSGWRT